jgi:aryl-alcohol dehydrogenase-like predicted oxidoreductase
VAFSAPDLFMRNTRRQNCNRPETGERHLGAMQTMETIRLGASGITASRIALGTAAMSGSPWSVNAGTGDSVRTIRTAIERGITLIDTSPRYGLGRAEELVGAALAGGLRRHAVIATKVGLEWSRGKVWPNASPGRIREEVEDSLRRLRTDYIDLYQLQSPDPLVPIEETAAEFGRLLKEGKIRAIGLSNFSRSQIAAFRQVAPVHSVQPLYNLFEREVEDFILPYAGAHGMTLLCHGTLCGRLLAGTVTPATRLQGEDARRRDPGLRDPHLQQLLHAVAALDRFARARYGRGVLALAVRWVLDQGHTIALWSACRPAQLDPVPDALGWSLDDAAMLQIDALLLQAVQARDDCGFAVAPARRLAPLRGLQ